MPTPDQLNPTDGFRGATDRVRMIRSRVAGSQAGGFAAALLLGGAAVVPGESHMIDLRKGGRVLPALLALLLCVGCGGSDSGDPGDPSEGGQSTAATTVSTTPDVPAPTESAAAHPTVEGNQLVDATTGEAWIPRGVNYPSFGYACAQGWGFSYDEANGLSEAATAAAIASWRANTVRLPLNQDCWNATDGVTAEYAGGAYIAAVTGFVQELNDAGLVVVLDLHSRKVPGEDSSGQRAMADAESLTFWSSVAAAFAENPSVMFDAFNEPYGRWDENGELVFDLDWGCWRDGGCLAPVENDDTDPLSGEAYEVAGMSQVVQAIRTAGAQQPILVAGLDYANDLREWLEHRPDDDDLVAAFHSYESQRCADTSCWNSEIGPIADQVPVVVGEFGVTTGNADSNAAYLTSLMDWADDTGVGYLIWAWWVDEDPSPDAYALLSNVDGTPRAPVGTTFHDHLTSLPGG